jgi:hypothetical protein
MLQRFLVLGLAFFAAPALAAPSTMTTTGRSSAFGDGDFGVGIGLIGVPALSVFAKTAETRHLQGGLTFGDDADFAATADYCFDYPRVLSGAPTVTPYWGGGAIMVHDVNDRYFAYDDDEFNSDTFVGGRIPLGLNFVIPRTPVQLGAEVAPTLLLTPISYSYLQGDLHVRVLF